MNRGWWLIAGFFAVGCASTQPFQPTSNVRKSLDNGPSFARYEVRTGAGDFGMVRVNLRTPGVNQGKLVVNMEIVNDSSKQIALDAERLAVQLITDQKKREAKIEPAQAPADTAIPGHSRKDYALEFPVDAQLKPKQVSAFELDWGLKLGSEDYTQVTGFSRDANRDDVYYVYDPFFYPYASYGYYGGPHRSRSSVNFGLGLGF